jgi:hypothetical protein
MCLCGQSGCSCCDMGRAHWSCRHVAIRWHVCHACVWFCLLKRLPVLPSHVCTLQTQLSIDTHAHPSFMTVAVAMVVQEPAQWLAPSPTPHPTRSPAFVLQGALV